MTGAAAARVAILYGAPGSGKSYAVSLFASAANRPAAIVRVRAGRSDLAAFARDVADAVGGSAPALDLNFAGALRRAQRAEGPAESLGAWFGRRLPAHATLVLDDLHLADPAVFAFLASAVDTALASVRWLFAVRETHRFPMVDWLARGVTGLPLELDGARGPASFGVVAPRLADGDALDALIASGDRDALAAYLDACGFDLLDARRDDVVERATARLSGDEHGRCAVAMLVTAMREWEAGRYDVAESWFQHAAHVAGDAASRARIELEYGCELLRRGRRDAVEILERAVASIAASSAARARSSLAGAYALAGDTERAATEVKAALALVDDGDASPSAEAVRARVFRQASYVFLRAGDDAAAADFARRSIALAERFGLDDITASALSVLLVIATTHGDDSHDVLTYLRRLEVCARELDDVYLLRYSLLGQVDLYGERGAWSEVARLEASLDLLEIENDAIHADETLVRTRALCAAARGEFAAAAALAGAAVAGNGDVALLCLAEFALYQAATGERAEAIRALGEADARGYGPSALDVRAALLCALAEFILDRAADARERLRRVADSALPFPRMRLLAAAVRYAIDFERTEESGDALLASLSELDACGLGGLAATIGALPRPFAEAAA